MVINPAHGPSKTDNKTAPMICPLDPVPGMAKFIICATKINAPIIPISGMILGFSRYLTLRDAITSNVAEIIPVTPAITGVTSASFMCMAR